MVHSFHLSALAVLAQCAGAADEISLMQGVKPIHGIKSKDKTSVSSLLETAGSMLKNGATPDVVTFARATLDEITTIVEPAIQHQHDLNRNYLDQVYAEFETALKELEEDIAIVNQRNVEERRLSESHKSCRQEEDDKCHLKKVCDYEIFSHWTTCISEERELRIIEEGITGHFCSDKNGTLTTFRHQSVPYFEDFHLQWNVVNNCEEIYDGKHPICEQHFSVLDRKTADCDALQTNLEDAACDHANDVKTAREKFSCAWRSAYVNYEQAVRHARIMQADRIKEYTALSTVQCLLDRTTERNGRPCEEHTEEAAVELTHCEEIGLTVDTTFLILIYQEVESFPLDCVDANNDNLADNNRCFPVPPNAPCGAPYLHQEYSSLATVPQPVFHSENTHCNQRPDCQDCNLQAEVLCLPFPPAGPVFVGHTADVMCSSEHTLENMACSAGMSEDDYCVQHPELDFCIAREVVCCEAFLLECQACSAGVSQGEYCTQNQGSELCPSDVVCCAAFSLECQACSAGVSQGEYCAQNQGSELCPSVRKSWDNHFAAFGGQNVEQILMDYTENSEIRVYDQTSGSLNVYTGLAGVRECFTGLFARLSDTSDLAAPVIDVYEATSDQPGSVFLVWNCLASGYSEATDSFIFDENSKILRQNVVVTDMQANGDSYADAEVVEATGSGAVHDGWANHFGAFGAQNVPNVKLDYTEESVIVVYNQVTGDKSVYEGLKGVEDCFVGLFDSLHDTSDLGAKIQYVEEGDTAEVFLIWRAPASGYKTGTDTFIFNSEGQILRQNVVVHYDPAVSIR